LASTAKSGGIVAAECAHAASSAEAALTAIKLDMKAATNTGRQ
jgi:hypothetical protein